MRRDLGRWRRTACIALLLPCAGTVGHAATYYIDFASGADTNTGASKSAAWKHAPGMQGFAGSYTHAAGDQFIFMGGAQCGSVGAPCWTATWHISNSGASGSPDYYGVDKTWYAGGLWTPPVIDGGSLNPITVTPWVLVSGSYVTLDGLQIQNLGVPGNNQGTYGIELSGNHDVMVENMVLPIQARIALFHSNETGGALGNILFARNDISAASWGIAVGTAAANSITSGISIHDNRIHDLHSQLADAAHGDGVIIYAAATDGTQWPADVDIYNNTFYGDFSKSDSSAAGMTAWIFCENCWGAVHIFNNAGSATAMSGGYAVEGGASTSYGPTPLWLVANNSFQLATGAQGSISVSGVSVLTAENNISTGGAAVYTNGISTISPVFTMASDYNLYYGWTGSFGFNLTYPQFQSSGPISSIAVKAGGSGYAVNDIIAPTYGQGARATVRSVGSGGSVTALSLTAGGICYTNDWPGLTAAVTGTGSGLTVAAHVTVPSGFETHGLNANPLFTSASTESVQGTSPAIGAGANLTSLGISALNVDANGAARPALGAWTMGAYQNRQYPNPPSSLTAIAH